MCLSFHCQFSLENEQKKKKVRMLRISSLTTAARNLIELNRNKKITKYTTTTELLLGRMEQEEAMELCNALDAMKI